MTMDELVPSDNDDDEEWKASSRVDRSRERRGKRDGKTEKRRSPTRAGGERSKRDADHARGNASDDNDEGETTNDQV